MGLSAQSSQKEIIDYLLKGDEQYTIFEEEYDKELTKEFTGKGSDEERLHNAALKTFYFYGKVAEQSQKASIQVNDSIAANRLMYIRPHLVNAGIYYNEEQEYTKAMHAFLAHWNYELLQPFLERQNITIEQDSINATIKYYAVACAIQSNHKDRSDDDVDRSIRLLNRLISEPYVENSTYKESDPYELLTMQYEIKGNQDKLIETLKTGMQKFPDNQYFAPTLVNAYIVAGEYETAISMIQQMIKDRPNEHNTLMPTIASIYLQEKDYKNAEKSYKAMLKKEKNNTAALEGLGRMYALMAQDKKEEALMVKSQKQIDKIYKAAAKQYKKALPYLAKQYKLLSEKEEKDNQTIRGSLQLLQNVYYNLTLSDTKQEENYQRVTDLLDSLDESSRK